MADTRKIVRVFLASPGDLKEERRTVKAVADEINNIWADSLGYQVELVGWEDTVSVLGRPQEIINRELKRCEYFIGMLWKRWGTPPNEGGNYSSGFEEEFEISSLSHQKSGSPQMSLFFKKVDDDQLNDPGPELRKVLDFKRKIEENRNILYENFETKEGLETQIRRCMSRYIQDLKLKEEIDNEEKNHPQKSGKNDSIEVTTTASPRETAITTEGASFLIQLIDKAQKIAHESDGDFSMNRLDGIDVSRFRLLGCVIYGQGNDRQNIGVHDANIIFNCRNEIQLSYKEIAGLIDSGLENYSNENVPLWFWVMRMGPKLDWLKICSLAGDEAERPSAINAMRIISLKLNSEDPASREVCLQSWFSENASDDIRVAALHYLGCFGTAEDLPLIYNELRKGDNKTSRPATDALLRIKFRKDRKDAIISLMELQTSSIDTSVVSEILNDLSKVCVDDISKGLGHENAHVRRVIVKELLDRGELAPKEANLLIEDNDAGVRYNALISLIKGGYKFSDHDIENILDKKNESGSLGLLGSFGRQNRDGNYYWKKFQKDRFMSTPLHELKEIANRTSIYDFTPFIIYCERQYNRERNKIKAHIRNKFSDIIGNKLKEVVAEFGPKSKISHISKDLMEYLQEKYTKEALDVVFRKGSEKDLPFVREELKKGWKKIPESVIDFFRKYGEWEDIRVVVNADYGPDGIGMTILSSENYRDRYRKVAHTVYLLGRNRFSELLSIDMSEWLLTLVIAEASEQNFRKLDDEAIGRLFQNESVRVRKAAALKCILVFPKKRLEVLLEKEIIPEKYRYYNVVHWLDFGISVNQSVTRQAAKKLISGISY